MNLNDPRPSSSKKIVSTLNTPTLRWPHTLFGKLAADVRSSLAHQREQAAGRTREVRWGARTLDVDVVTVTGDGGTPVVSDDPVLTLPHPPERVWIAVVGVHLQWTFDPFSGVTEVAAGTTNEGLKDGQLGEAWFDLGELPKSREHLARAVALLGFALPASDGGLMSGPGAVLTSPAKRTPAGWAAAIGAADCAGARKQ